MRTVDSLRSVGAMLAVIPLFGCVIKAAVPERPDPNDLRVVMLDGVGIPTDHLNLLEFLRRGATSLRLGDYAAGLEEQPLVIVDGVRMLDGVRRLELIPAFHADSVRILRPIEATTIHGARGRMGAIVVFTRRGTDRTAWQNGR